MSKIRLLFICTNNVCRSPTAEDLFKNSNKFEAKSAGIHPFATQHINQRLIDWTDEIFVMSEKEDRHLTYLQENFDLKDKKVYDLEVSDIYPRGDPRLIEILKSKLSKYLKI